MLAYRKPSDRIPKSFRNTPKLCAYDLLNGIGFLPDDVEININEQKLGIEGNIDWIRQRCQTDYYLILCNDDCFYEKTSLENICQCADNSKAKTIFGTNVIFSDQGSYLGNEESQPILFKKIESKQVNIQPVAETKNPILRRIKKENFVSEMVENICTESNNLECIMNKSDYKVLLQICGHIKNEVSKKIFLQEQIGCILNNARHSVWGLTNSKRKLISVLNEARLNYSIDVIDAAKNEVRDKIKVLFLAMEFSVFPTIQCLYDLAKKDIRFEADLVYVPFQHPNKQRSDMEELEAYRKHGYDEIVSCEKYDLVSASPDVAIFIKSYDCIPRKFYISEIYKVIQYNIFIRYALYNIDTQENAFFERTVYRSGLNYLAWKNCINSKKAYERAQVESWTRGKNYWGIGSPRYDMRMEQVERTFPDEMNIIRTKAKQRKIIFWNSQHQIGQCEHPVGTFLVLGKDILEEIRCNPKLFVVWRPHPLFWQALEQYCESNNEEFRNILDDIERIENLYIDKNDSYLPCFVISDALMSDGSSLVGEYLITGKPICMLINSQRKELYPEEYLRCLHAAGDKSDVSSFLQEILDGVDSKYNERMKCIKQNFFYNKGKSVSEEIIEIISEELTV